MKSDFRQIDGSVLLSLDGEEQGRASLFMYGGIAYLFVQLPYRSMMSHLSPNGTLGMDGNYRWSDLQLGEAYRLVEPSNSVVSVIDIARETAKRLGVK